MDKSGATYTRPFSPINRKFRQIADFFRRCAGRARDVPSWRRTANKNFHVLPAGPPEVEALDREAAPGENAGLIEHSGNFFRAMPPPHDRAFMTETMRESDAEKFERIGLFIEGNDNDRARMVDRVFQFFRLLRKLPLATSIKNQTRFGKTGAHAERVRWIAF